MSCSVAYVRPYHDNRVDYGIILIIIAITIGLTSTSYTVDERSMTALLTVSVQNGTFDGDSNITVYVRLFTLDGTASYNNGMLRGIQLEQTQ